MASARAGEHATARFYLEKVLNRAADPAQEAEAYYWLSQIESDPSKKRAYIEHVLSLFPAEPRARRELATLDGRLDPQEIVNPDTLAPSDAEAPAEVSGQRHECPRCGSRLVFSPNGSGRRCENCGYSSQDGGRLHEQDQGQESIRERDFVSTIHTARGHSKPQQQRVFECRACGARYLLGSTALGITCPHCDSVYSVAIPEEHGIIPPSAFVQPLIEPGDAEQRIRGWWRDNRMRHAGALGRLTGAYLPFWTFDILGQAAWRAEVSRDQVWQTITGTALVDLNDVLVPASRVHPVGLEESFEDPWQLPLRPFSMDALAGWLAETYTVAMADAAVSARARAIGIVKRKVHKDIPGDARGLNVNSLNLAIEQYKLVLLPWWVGHYALDGKRFAVGVNAWSGSVVGDLPKRARPGFLRRLLGG
jgi:DNA-directed RNA polymerase subunit M/transcription elongation factor TFIIS